MSSADNIFQGVKPLPNDKSVCLSKLKAFADDIMHVYFIENIANFLCERLENIAGKGENAGYQHFLLFPQCFQNVSSFRSLKLGILCLGAKRH